MNRLKWFWGNLQTSFWFVPSLIVAGSIVLAAALIEADSVGSRQWMAQWPRLFGVGAAGARGMLSTIAGSMMTVVGITFSMTLMTLVLASSQYTSRILRNFMRDRITQVVLGIFAGVFTYCLIVLRTIRGGDEAGFIPSLAVSFGIVLAICGIGVLIFFIHHIASSIQASNVIASVAAETMAAVDRLFPEERGEARSEGDEDQAPPPLPERHWQAVPARRDGYVQNVNSAMLLRLAREHQVIVRMECGVGEFVLRDTALASIALKDQPGEEIIAALEDAYSIDRHRTVDQDAAFGIRQIVDMALRALSPSMNDTTTAVMCVDYLTAILARLAVREIPSSRRFDEDGELRLITIGPTFAGLMSEAFDEVRASAEANVAILWRLLWALETIASRTASPSRRRAIQAQVQRVAESAARSIKSPTDRARFEKRSRRVREEPIQKPPDEGDSPLPIAGSESQAHGRREAAGTNRKELRGSPQTADDLLERQTLDHDGKDDYQ